MLFNNSSNIYRMVIYKISKSFSSLETKQSAALKTYNTVQCSKLLAACRLLRQLLEFMMGFPCHLI